MTKRAENDGRKQGNFRSVRCVGDQMQNFTQPTLNYAICNLYLRNLVETEYTGNVTDIVLFIGCKTCLLCKLISPEVTVMNLFAILRVSLVG